MEQGTRTWLSYTDNLLAKGDKTSEEIALLMAVQRGPDYVRVAAREGAPISPKSEDRQPIKLVTTAVIRALCFPKTAKLLAAGGAAVAKLQKEFGISAEKAKAAAALLQLDGGNGDRNVPNWQVNTGKDGYTPFSIYSQDHKKVEAAMAQVGTQSHFGIKVRKAAALLGYTI